MLIALNLKKTEEKKKHAKNSSRVENCSNYHLIISVSRNSADSWNLSDTVNTAFPGEPLWLSGNVTKKAKIFKKIPGSLPSLARATFFKQIRLSNKY
jgi:hypothetical protein